MIISGVLHITRLMRTVFQTCILPRLGITLTPRSSALQDIEKRGCDSCVVDQLFHDCIPTTGVQIAHPPHSFPPHNTSRRCLHPILLLLCLNLLISSQLPTLQLPLLQVVADTVKPATHHQSSVQRPLKLFSGTSQLALQLTLYLNTSAPISL